MNMQTENHEPTPSPENAGRKIDFEQVKRWVSFLGSQTEGTGNDSFDLHEEKANAIVGFTEEDEKNYWDRNDSKKTFCSCKNWSGLPGCLENTEITFKDGTKMPAIPFGQEKGVGEEEVEEGEGCHDCACLPANFHHPGCDMEECPRCGRQALICDCLNGYVDEEAERKGKRRDYLAQLLMDIYNSRFFNKPQTPETLKSFLRGEIETIAFKEVPPSKIKMGMEEYLEILGYFEWLESEN